MFAPAGVPEVRRLSIASGGGGGSDVLGDGSYT